MSASPRETLEQVLARARQAGAHAADARLVESDELEARVRGDEIDHVKQARERSLDLRVFVKGPGGLRTAATSSSDLTREAVERLADESVALARATAPDPVAGLPDGGFADETPDLGLFDPADRDAGVEARLADARKCEDAARGTDPRIANSEGSDVGAWLGRVHHANSEGFYAEYAGAQHSLVSMPIAQDGHEMQTDYWMTRGRRLADLEAPESVGRHAARRALARLGSKRIATCEVPVVFDAMTARSVLGHLASCVSGSALYRKASFLDGRLGEPIASEAVSVIDDGRLPGGLGSKPFDGEGLPTRRNVVIENGRLASWLLDSYSARKLGLASTGSAQRGGGGAVSAGTSNFWLEPGSATPEELVAGVERGLLVTWLFGHGFNPVTGDFSRGAAGLWIEDGEAKFPVHEITVAGNLGDMLAGIDGVGNDLLWLGSVAAPSLRIARMTVAGE